MAPPRPVYWRKMSCTARARRAGWNEPFVKKIALIVLFFCVLAVGALVLVSGLAVYSGRQQSALLAQPPQHGTSFVIEPDASQTTGGTNVLANLRETLQRRFYRFGTRIFWESLPGSRIHIDTPVTDPNQFE